MSAEQNKLLVRRLVEGINNGSLEVLNEVADGTFARAARQWIGPFLESFPDFRMEIVDLIADDEKVAAHFRCSGTHLGQCRGHRPSGRRFRDVDEIYIYRVRNGKLAAATGVEDKLARHMTGRRHAKRRPPRRRTPTSASNREAACAARRRYR